MVLITRIVMAASATVAESLTALQRVRELLESEGRKTASVTEKGEDEHAAFWDQNYDLFREARAEYGRKHPELYNVKSYFSPSGFLDPVLLQKIAEVEQTLKTSVTDEDLDKRLLLSSVEEEKSNIIQPVFSIRERWKTKEGYPYNVYKLRVFTKRFCRLLREEVQHWRNSGIPLRRPNGMNRFGAILEDLEGLGEALNQVAKKIIQPIGQMLFPFMIGPHDAEESYSFVVQYKVGEDEVLDEHADASVLTLNVQLGGDELENNLEGNGLRFGTLREIGTTNGRSYLDSKGSEEDGDDPTVDFSTFGAGEGVLHLGQHRHQVLRITQGERANMVMWLHGENGYVRAAPYSKREEWTSVEERWLSSKHVVTEEL